MTKFLPVAAPAVRLAHRFTAPPEQIFKAWLDPQTAGRWLFATATRPMTEVRITPRAGGRFRFTDGEALYTGRYIRIARPNELTFSLDDTKIRSTVSIELIPRGGTGCLLRLEQQLPSRYAGFAEERWSGMFYGLSLLLASNEA